MNFKPLNIVIKDSDYRYGDGNIPFKLRGITTENWGSHFEFQVWQLLKTGDTDDCWDFGGIKGVDAFMDALILENILPASVVQQITTWGFMDVGLDGKSHFHSSPRFPGVMTGIGQNGASVQAELDFAKTYGLLPFTMLPVTAGMTLAEYFDPTAITQEMKDIALAFRNLMGGKDFILYQWVNDGGATDIPKMAAAQPAGPFSLGIPVNNVNGGWNQVHPALATGSPVHVVNGYAVDLSNYSVPISDNYAPFLKVLDKGYQISYVLQIIVQYIPPKPIVVPPLPSMPTTVPITQNTVNILTMLVSLYQKLLALVSPTERAKLGGASRSSAWPAFRAEYAKTHLPVCAICGKTKGLNLHHLYVFHAFPEYELSEWNVRWLCHEHHLYDAHLGDFSSIDPNGAENIVKLRDAYRSRPMTVTDIKKDMPAPPIKADFNQK